MKKLFFWICLLSFSFFATDAMANLSGNESAIAENSNVKMVKENHPRPFKGTTVYPLSIPGFGFGHATHLGFITTDTFFDPSTGMGTEKMHASDGSELDLNWTWNLADNTGTWQITGGSGRFTDATGGGEWTGYFTPDNLFFILNSTGTISY